jgi:glycerol-3-phosphate acyltransferase PlsY
MPLPSGLVLAVSYAAGAVPHTQIASQRGRRVGVGPWGGGRGVSPALGALMVTAPAGAVVLLGGLAVGRPAHQTGLGCLLSFVALVPVLRRTAGRGDARMGVAVLVPLPAKRLLGNRPAASPRVYGLRLLFDRDTA